MIELTRSEVTSKTKKFVFEVKEFLKIMENYGEVEVFSPSFHVGKVIYSFQLYNGDDDSFNVSLNNHTIDEDGQIISFTMAHSCGREKKILGDFDEINWSIMSKDEYKDWAEAHGDVLILEVIIEIRVRDNPVPEVPISLRPEGVISSVNRVIMEDESTTDFSVRCDTKTFRVHKSFLCARSDVFRAMISGSMKEAREGEVCIEDLDEGTLRTVITFIYTGELEISPDINVQNLATAAEKYNLAGMMELLCFKLRQEDTIKPRTIADMLLTATKHDKKEMRALVLSRVRSDRNILNDQEFRERMNQADDLNIAFDLFKDL